MTVTDPATLRLAAIVNSSDDAIISHNTDGTIDSWNPAAERMFGYTAADAIGRHIDLIIAPDRRDDERRMTDRVNRGETVRHFETLALARNGTRIHVSLALSPIVTPDGQLLGVSRVVRNISQQRRFERDLAWLATIVNSADDAVVSKDLDGIVQTWNPAAERMFGYRAAEMVGQPITRIIPAERLPEEDEVLRRIRAGRAVEHFETVRQRKDGSPVEISLSVSPIKTADGHVIGASKIARDISAQRRLARTAEEAGRVKDEFLAMLSHELRTPLNAVLGYTRMLRNRELPEARQARAIDTIERNANILSQLVSDVLDVSSIVTGKVELRLARADLLGITGAAVDTIGPSAEAKGVTIQVQMPDAPLVTRGDPDRLQQVLWNLLTNAVKFTPSGGRIDVRVTRDEDTRSGVIAVSDTGIGIDAAALPYVFHRFWQGEGPHARQTGGLGLGLALARHFTELHGGSIAADSAGVGRGATFIVRLPLAN